MNLTTRSRLPGRDGRQGSSHPASAPPGPAHHEFGLVFKKMRMAREMTRTHLAKKLGLAPAYIRQVENGRKRPSRATIAKLAEGLGISLIVALAVLRAGGDDLNRPQSDI